MAARAQAAKRPRRPRRDALTELSVAQVLAPERHEPLEPPIAAPASLPLDQLAPPVFERLIAEVAARVDGIGRLRIYGRSGQRQHGLDIWGGPVDHRSVYQVRRIRRLTVARLRKAVEDYAKSYDSPPTATPSAEASPAPSESPRFQARRFVLAVGCEVPRDHAVGG